MKIQTEPTCHKWYPQIGTVTVSAPSRGMSSKMYLNHANFGGTKPSEKSTKMKLLNLLTKKSHINTYHKSSQISRITYHLLFLLLHPSIHPSSTTQVLLHPNCPTLAVEAQSASRVGQSHKLQERTPAMRWSARLSGHIRPLPHLTFKPPSSKLFQLPSCCH